ncbi:unnamed protein product, partial [Lampetra fluviatilis]
GCLCCCCDADATAASSQHQPQQPPPPPTTVQALQPFAKARRCSEGSRTTPPTVDGSVVTIPIGNSL